ncbi:uncharacterized protein [Antedon mediterranea]|uniref:uncharacterized protein n=1 Tax=Antedon mediterranea TaxID=105859 RepID=UPI003AF9B3F6
MSCGINGYKNDHNRLLHREKVEKESNFETVEVGVAREGEHKVTKTETGTNTTLLSKNQSIALRTIPIIVSNGKKRIEVNALLDDGSTQTYVNEELCGELGLSEVTEEMVVSLLSGNDERFVTKPVEIFVLPLDGSKKFKVNAVTISDVTGRLEASDWSSVNKDWDHLRDIEFLVISSQRKEIDLLIGVDCPQLHTALEEKCGGPGEPVARRTPLGWTCVGPLSRSLRTISLHVNTYKTSRERSNDVDELMRKFWEVDSYGVSDLKIYKAEDERVIQKVSESLTAVDERYSVNIPWREEGLNMDNNYEMAFKRLECLERKLTRDKMLGDNYQNVLDNYRSKGYVRKIDQSLTELNQWFLPHFPVVKPERETTKVRLVFDAAARYGGRCLNDMIYPGPKLQTDLFDVLLRFRKEKVAIICDIAEIYLQIGVQPEDRKMLRFLWQDLDTERMPEIYEFNRLVFGLNVAPFLAQFVTQEQARKNSKEYLLGARAVLDSTYMDDTMASVKNEQEAVELYREIKELWGSAGMSARKWVSNSKAVLEKIPEVDRAKEIKLSGNELPSAKTLGFNMESRGRYI